MARYCKNQIEHTCDASIAQRLDTQITKEYTIGKHIDLGYQNGKGNRQCYWQYLPIGNRYF